MLDESFGLKRAMMTTVHAYTADQPLADAAGVDLRRSRSAVENIIPNTTLAPSIVEELMPQFSGKLDGIAFNVPVPNGSLTDMTVNVKRQVTISEVNKAFKAAADGHLKQILQYTDDPIVSVDIIGNTHSCIFDAEMTSVIGKMVKIIGWYDNEAGYSSRIVDLILQVSRK